MIDRQVQVAELLKLLGNDTADAVLSHLPAAHAESLREKMSSEAASQVKLDDKREILKDFESFFGFALETAPPALQVFDQEAGEEAETQAAPDPAPQELPMTGDPMVDLERLSIYQLAGALETEQPRTVAILLNSIGPQVAANVLSFLPDEFRQSVVRQLSKEQNAPQVLVERIARATVQRGVTLSPEAPDRRNHVDRLSEVMREVPKSYRKEMLDAVAQEDADLSAALLRKLYLFEDIVKLEPHVVQQILGEVDVTTLTTAMYGADEEIVNSILNNLSRRARTTIEEELQFQARLPDTRVREARESIAELIAQTDQEGE